MRWPFVLCPDLINADLLMLPGLALLAPLLLLAPAGVLHKPLAGIVAVFCLIITFDNLALSHLVSLSLVVVPFYAILLGLPSTFPCIFPVFHAVFRFILFLLLLAVFQLPAWCIWRHYRAYQPAFE